MRKVKLLLMLILHLSFQESAAFNFPKSLFYAESSTLGRALGPGCFAFDRLRSGLPCHPSYIAEENQSEIHAAFYVGNNINYADEVRSILAGDVTEQNLSVLFEQTRGSTFETNVEASYRRSNFGISLSPSRLVYSSFIRNTSLPVVTVYAAHEQSLRLQWASFVNEDWNWGLQTRYVQRKFISSAFAITDVFVEGGSRRLEAKNQSVLYFEPGVMKEWLNKEWKPRLTLLLSQLGIFDRKYDEFPSSPELLVGLSGRPDLNYGSLQLGLSAHVQTKDHKQIPLRAATQYEVGITTFAASFGESDYSTGLLARYKYFQVGLNLQNEKIENWQQQTEWVRTLSVQLGATL